jgi:probable HAF family extracellular repeat protein
MRKIPYLVLLAGVLACDDRSQVTTEPADELAAHGSGARYRVVMYPATLGGPVSVATSINDRGRLAGFSDLGTEPVRHAVLWRRDGTIDDLGTLGGPNSNVQWPGQNDWGMVVGISETEELDPNREPWSCTSFFRDPSQPTGHVCRGFAYYDGRMHELPTLGGTHGFATSVNNRGQVVGWAETTVEDPTCSVAEGQVLQFRAVLWEPKKDRHRELRPLRGDSTSAATGINDRGQAVGISGRCDVAVGRLSAQHMVLWQGGKPKRIPDLGGEAWNTPMDINDKGVVVGFLNPRSVPGTAFQPVGFVWTKWGGTKELPPLEGHLTAQAYAVNDKGLIVGRSCAGPCRAVIWKNRRPIDLNTIIGNYPHVLTAARDINEDGVITGNLVKQGTDTIYAFVAIPK